MARRLGAGRCGARSLVVVALLTGLVAVVRAETPAGSAGGASSETPRVGLDKLLELPKGLDYGGAERGGMTRGEWRSRFTGLRAALAHEEKALAAARKELDEIAGSADAWSIGPPIPGVAANPDSPLDYRLRLEIDRHKAEIARLKRALRELGVQADLANVPAEWRE